MAPLSLYGVNEEVEFVPRFVDANYIRRSPRWVRTIELGLKSMMIGTEPELSDTS